CQVLAVTASEAPVHGDLDDLGILLRNLVDNAVRYAGEGARIEIDCRIGDGHARLRVCDDGPGVPPGERERIFERFFRGSNGNGERGSGIGLSLVARIAARHGATLAVSEGIGGRGHCVSVAFPLPAARGPARRPPAGRAPARARATRAPAAVATARPPPGRSAAW